MLNLINGLGLMILTYLKSFISIYNQLTEVKDEIIAAIFGISVSMLLVLSFVFAIFKKIK